MAWALLVPSPALAQAAPPIFADRPDFTESATLTPSGEIRFEGGWTTQGDDRVDVHTFGAVVRSGIAERWETWVEVTWHAIDDARGLEVSGRGDADAGVKIGLRETGSGRNPAALLVSSTVPIGDDDIGERGWQPEARLLVEWDLSPKWSAAMNAGGGLPLVGGERFAQALGSASIGRSIGTAVLAIVEVYAIGPADPSGRDAAYAEGGLGFDLGGGAALDLRLGLGLVEASPDWLFGLELSRRLAGP